jgi:hypothetical protein
LMPYLGMNAARAGIPDYWKVAYLTGFDKIPDNILTVIGKLASIFILQQLGDVILGPGISSMSLGLDGLSQSVSSTKSASNSAFGSRISVYTKDLERELPALHDFFTGFVFTAL